MTAHLRHDMPFTTISRIADRNLLSDDKMVLLVRDIGRPIGENEPVAVSALLGTLGRYDTLAVMAGDPELSGLARRFQAWAAAQTLKHFQTIYPDETAVADQIAVMEREDASPAERQRLMRSSMDVAVAARNRAYSRGQREFPENFAAAQSAFAAAVDSVLHGANHAANAAGWASGSPARYEGAKADVMRAQEAQLWNMFGEKA